MNKLKRMSVIFIMLAAISAFTLQVSAIEFDAEETYNSVFVIHSRNSLGSGFAIGENSIITNAHVVTDSNEISITTYDGSDYPAYIVAMDSKLDIVILGVDGASFVPLKVADYKSMSIGSDVYAVGAPNCMAYTLTKGCLSAKDRVIGQYNYIQTDAAINTGNSGGPLLDSDGSVIGVNSYKISDAEGIGLAIPMTLVIDFLSKNHINTNENGNIDSLISKHGGSETKSSSEDKTENIITETKKVSLMIIMVVSFLISMILNIILIILLVYHKKKNIDIAYDPKERTDFEIDILE